MGKERKNERAGCLPYSHNNSFYSAYSGERKAKFFVFYFFITGTAILAPTSVCAPKLKVGATLLASL